MPLPSVQLMKEPVLQDKRSEHARFCRYAAELMERVSGRRPLGGGEVSLARLQRASVVAQTRISFSQRELLMLIRSHLLAKGLHHTAQALLKEAHLPASPPCTPCTPPTPRICRLAGGGAARAGASPVSSVSASPSSRPPISSHPPSSSSAPPHRPVGRILFSRERPVVHPTSGKKLRPLKQKSDHGAFIQVSLTL